MQIIGQISLLTIFYLLRTTSHSPKHKNEKNKVKSTRTKVKVNRAPMKRTVTKPRRDSKRMRRSRIGSLSNCHNILKQQWKEYLASLQAGRRQPVVFRSETAKFIIKVGASRKVTMQKDTTRNIKCMRSVSTIRSNLLLKEVLPFALFVKKALIA